VEPPGYPPGDSEEEQKVNVPEDRRYTDQHEWVLSDEAGVRIGITDYAQDALGDVVFVDLLAEPGAEVEAGDTIAEVESTKSVAEVYAPIAGRVVAVNDVLSEAPETVNTGPYTDGWFIVIDPANPDGVDTLLDAAGYLALIA
jgi:glycine cleavage system H protein